MGRYDVLWDRVKKEFPKAKVVPKSKSLLMRTAFWFVKHVLRQKTDYSKGFLTTIGCTIYVPDTFDEWTDSEKYRILRHELTHIRQARYWPFPWLGKVPILRFVNAFLWGFCYLFVFPAKITLRAHFEREGYTQTMLANVELGRLDPNKKDHVLHWMRKMEKTFSSGVYFYMAKEGKGAEFAAKTLQAIADGQVKNDTDRVDLAS